LVVEDAAAKTQKMNLNAGTKLKNESHYTQALPRLLLQMRSLGSSKYAMS
jgi:hypothetical protein